MNIIELDLIIWENILDFVDPLTLVKKCWLHNHVGCDKYLAMHRAIPATTGFLAALNELKIPVIKCDCIEWKENYHEWLT